MRLLRRSSLEAVWLVGDTLMPRGEPGELAVGHHELDPLIQDLLDDRVRLDPLECAGNLSRAVGSP